jgi:hypothetical protein
MPALAGNPGSQPAVAVELVPVCHAGGRGFESREDSELAHQYGALKLQLAVDAPNRDAYTAGKSAFIAGVIAR